MHNVIKIDNMILNEYRKCFHNPIYFIETYCEIKLYDYQKDYINLIHNNNFVLGDWVRQTGKTFVSLGYILWTSIFKYNQNIVLMNGTLRQATTLFETFKYMRHKLPSWMKSKILENNQRRMIFSNGNKVIISSKFTNLRGMTISLMYVDEFAVFDNAHEIFDYLPVLHSLNGKLIITSTEKKISLFNQLCHDALYGLSNFIIHRVRWNQVPGRDSTFKEKMIELIGQEGWDREYESSL